MVTEAGRLAVVVGAGKGIGRGTAFALADAGYRVVAADIDLAAAEDTARRIGATGHAVAVDAREPDSLQALGTMAEALGPIDLWVNSAGVSGLAPITDITPEFYEQIRRINMDGTFWGCAEAARRMIPHGRGCIVNISSNAADQPIPTLSVYAMTKAAVNMLTRSLAIELGPHGIRVNCVAPGFILTPMTAPDSLTPDERETLIERNALRSPLHRVGEPEDIAATVASDAARFVTGQTWRVNGGVSMP